MFSASQSHPEYKINRDNSLVKLAAIQQQENRRIMISLKNKGLCSLRDISTEDALVNPVLQTQGLEGDICVNYLDLTNADEKETQLVMKTITHEEFTGIYGITCERQAPFQQFGSLRTIASEASARLMNCIVLILNPPDSRTEGLITRDLGVQQNTTIGFYNTASQSFNQARGDSLLGDSLAFTNRVTEISTSHVFKFSTSVKALLVPEPLLTTAKEVFADCKIDIIPVPAIKITLTKIPKILDYMHGEKLLSPIQVEAPKFSQTIADLCQQKKWKKFSIHAVRMNTCYDFMVRPLANSLNAKHQAIISSVQGTITPTQPDNSSFFIVHKRFGMSRKPIIQKITKEESLPRRIIVKIIKANEASEQIFSKLKSCSGDNKLLYVYKILTSAQIQYLKDKCHANVINFDQDCYAISYQEKYKTLLKEAIQHFDKVQATAAIQIQGLFRGWRTRVAFSEFKEKKHSLVKAQQAFALAAKKLGL